MRKLVFLLLSVFLLGNYLQAQPLAITASSTPSTWSGNTCLVVDNCPTFGGSDVQYQVTIPFDGDWTFSLCGGSTDFLTDFKLSLGTTLCSDDIAFNDNGGCATTPFAPEITASITAGVYSLTIDAPFLQCGDFSLSISGIASGGYPNNFCDGAIPISCGDVVTGTTIGGALQGGLGCGVGAPLAWYELPGTGGPITLSTCGPGTDYNTEIHIFSGDCFGLSCLQNANTATCETITFNSTEGVTYLVAIGGGTSLTSGNFQLSVNAGLSIECPDLGLPFPTDPGLCEAEVDIPPATAVGCPDLTFSHSVLFSSGLNSGEIAGADASGVYPEGFNVITFSVEDGEGNMTSCTTTLLVLDNEGPEITNCPADISVNTEPGICEATVTSEPLVAVDNCTPIGVLQNDYTGTNNSSGTYFPDTTLVIWTVSDLDGNQTQCVQTVVVTDNELPTITCPANITVENDPGLCRAFVTVPQPVTADNCGVASVLNNKNGTNNASSNYNVGVRTVIWQVTDVWGNTASCSMTVTVLDTEDPMITCPANITVNAAPGLCTANVSVPNGIVSDNCSFTVVNDFNGTSDADGTYNVGTTPVVFTATDPAGNSASCTMTVTVNDTQIPSISCPNNVTNGNNANLCSRNVTLAPATAMDNCAVSSIANSYNAGGAVASGVYPVGVTVVTFTATDVNGNTNTCTTTITINDVQAPNITCPLSTTVTNDNGLCGANVTVALPVATDNCGIASVLNNFNGTGNASGFYPVGTTNVVFTATDIYGLTKTCNFDVTVNDQEAPTITCPGPISAENDPGVCQAFVTIPAISFNDNCPGATISNDYNNTANASDTYPVGETEVTVTVTDAVGEMTNCSFVVTVNDTEDPEITCPADITESTDAGLCSASVFVPIPDVDDNCTGGSIPSIVSFLFEDFNACGLPSGWSTETVLGFANWFITNNLTPDPDTQGNIDGTCMALFNDDALGFSAPISKAYLYSPVLDVTGVASLELNFDYIFEDLNNSAFGVEVWNGASWVEVLYLSGEASDPGCFGFNIGGAGCDPGVASLDVTPYVNTNFQVRFLYDDNTMNPDSAYNWFAAFDNFEISGVMLDISGLVATNNFNNTPNASGVYPLGTTPVVWTVTDGSGNSSSCTMTVTIEDNELPTITCPGNINVNAPEDLCGNTINYSVPVGLDNCSGVSTSLTDGLASGAFFPVGTTTVTYTVTDGSFNQASCSFTVTVNDVQPPEIMNCAIDYLTTAEPNVCGATVNFVPPFLVDNCSGGTLTQTCGLASGSFFDVGESLVCFQAVDNAGNITNCSFTVTVTDNQNPTITCYTNITLSTDTLVCETEFLYPPPIGMDNCPGAITTLTGGLGSGGIFPIGLTTETYTVTDASGNTASCSFTITVIDDEVPLLADCPGNAVLVNSPGQCGAVYNYTAPTATDNCVTLTPSFSGLGSGALFPIGVSTETYTFADGAGNQSVCSFTVTVSDTQNPTITCPTPIFVGNNPGICGAVVNFGPASASDNCPGVSVSQTGGPLSGSLFPVGVTNINFVAVDASGNSATCFFPIAVQDQQNPTVSCPPNQTVNAAPGECGNFVNYPNGAFSDNCPGVSLALTAGLGDNAFFPVGVTTETYTATDAAGNTSSCSFTVTVVDNQVPTISCPANISVSNNPGICGAAVTYATPTFSDNCPGSTLTLTSGLSSGSIFPVGYSEVNYTVTDPSGQTASCMFSVIVLDSENPTITCPASITVENDPGEPGANVTWPAGTFDDNCPGESLALTGGINWGGFFPIGPTLETYTVTDAAGNQASCSFTVTVLDTEDPEIACLVDITDINDPGQCGGKVFFTAPSFTDNAPGTTIIQISGPSSGSVFFLGDTEICYEATDASGNTTECCFNVSMLDAEPPTVECVVDIFTETDDPSGKIVNYSPPTFFDNCPGGEIVQLSGIGPGGFFPVGVTTETWLAIDEAGLVDTCVFTVTVGTTADPCLAPMNPSVTLNSPTNVVLSWTAVSGATLYQVKGRKQASLTGGFASVTTPNTSRNVGGLEPGTAYEWKVRARCADGQISPFTALIPFTTPMSREDLVEFDDILIFPNPANDRISVNYRSVDDKEVEISIVNIIGQKLISERTQLVEGGNNFDFDLSAYSAGVYFLEVSNGIDHVSQKFVISR